MDVLAVGVHVRHLLVHKLLVVDALLLALVDLPQLWAKLLHDLLESLRQVVDRLPFELSIDDFFLVEQAPLRISLRLQ